jgi:superfamily II DNA or RNA helicase
MASSKALLDTSMMDSPCLAEWETSKSLGTLIVDEADWAPAPSYKTILDALAAGGVPVIGLTATPFRMEYDPKDQDAGIK